MSSYKPIFLLIFFLAILACKSNDSNSEMTPESPTKAKEESLPGLQLERYKELIENCDFIDYIFHTLPVSMSQDEKSSIVSNIKFIANRPVETLNKSCKSMARIIYSSQGEIFLEADLYFSQGCTYFVFIENEKPFAANLMTQEGAQFYSNIINQINSSNPNAQGSSN